MDGVKPTPAQLEPPSFYLGYLHTGFPDIVFHFGGNIPFKLPLYERVFDDRPEMQENQGNMSPVKASSILRISELTDEGIKMVTLVISLVSLVS